MFLLLYIPRSHDKIQLNEKFTGKTIEKRVFLKRDKKFWRKGLEGNTSFVIIVAVM